MKLIAFKTLLLSALLFVSFIIGTGSVSAIEERPQACPPVTYDLDTGIFKAPDVKVDILGTPLHFEVKMSTVGLNPILLQLESAIPKETGDEPGPIIVPAGPDLQRLGVSKVEVLSSDISGAQFRVFAEDGEELGIVELKGEMVVESDESAFTTTAIRTFMPADGTEAVSVHLQNWMPRDTTGVKRFPSWVIFESGDRRVQISYDLLVENADFQSATIEGIHVESGDGLTLELTAEELADAEFANNSYRGFLIEADAEFVLDNPMINIAMTLPIDNQVIQYTPEGIFYLTSAGDDHDGSVGPIPEHSFWGCTAACGTHAACYFGAQIPPPCWVACAICGWCLGEAIWGAF